MYESYIVDERWKKLHTVPYKDIPIRDRPLKLEGSPNLYPSIASLQSHAKWLQSEVKALSKRAESFAEVLGSMGMNGNASAAQRIAGELTACTNFDFHFLIDGLVGWEEHLRKRAEDAE